MSFSLHDWLSTPSRGRRDFGTTAKRAIVGFLLFLLPLISTIVAHALINMYDIPYPYWLHWLVYAIELITFFALLYGLFKEKLAFILPFIVVESLKLVVWGVYTVIYLIRLILNAINDDGGPSDSKTVVVPGVVAVKTNHYVDEEGRVHYSPSDHSSNYWLTRVLGPLAIITALHALTLCAAISVYQAIRHILHQEERQRLPTTRTTGVAGSQYDKDAVLVTRTTTQQIS